VQVVSTLQLVKLHGRIKLRTIMLDPSVSFNDKFVLAEDFN
jgi:hypothetical protein